MSEHYRVKLDCDECSVPLVVTTLFVGSNWELIANLRCPKCNNTGHCYLDICELVAKAREAAGVLLT